MLELQRNVVFGQFVETGSFVHRMDARVKFAVAVVLIVAAFLIGSFVGFGMMILLAALIQYASRIPIGYLLRGSQFFLGLLAFILIFQVLFYSGGASEQSVLWNWGILSISTAGLKYAGILGLRVLLLYYTTTMLMLTTSLVDLTNALELIFGPLQRIRIPVNELILVFVIAIKFVPIYIEEMESFAKARTARGFPFDEGGPLTRARRLGRLLIPIFIKGFTRAELLSTAMSTRCYRGGRGRTKLRQMQATASDWIVLVLVIGWAVLAWQAPAILGI